MGSLLWLYQLLCFLLLFHLQFLATCSSSSMLMCPHDQSFALLQFKRSLSINSSSSSFGCDNLFGIASYPKTNSWKEGADCCSWDGVTCDSITGHVIGLDLSCSWLYGTIPLNSSLFLLPHLKSLNLACNDFRNSIIPSQFGWFASLTHLNLSTSFFSGPIPSQISHLSRLISLDLSSYYVPKLRLELETSTLKAIVHNLTEVRELFLDRINMSSVALDSFVNLSSSLTSLSLSDCDLRGNFPINFFYLPKLVGSISSAQKLPFGNLTYLDLHSNFLQGPLPISPLTVRFFSISNNNFTGEISSLICNASSLQILDLSHNNLSGMLPQCIANFSKSLSVLNLQKNNLHGTIPTAFSQGCGLRNLNFHGNQLEGPLPQTLVYCRNLEVLELSNNKIDDKFPYWLGSLPELQVLVLRYNKFHGYVLGSKANCSFPKLRIFDLSNNDFEGPLPTEYIKNFNAMMNVSDGKNDHLRYMGDKNYSYDYSATVIMKSFDIELNKILTIFTSIDLSENKFEGEIPEAIGMLNSLRGLNFSHNKLTGDIPPSMGKLTNLEWLDLSSNKLVGEVPWQLANLTFLSVLGLSHNQLVSIPQGVMKLLGDTVDLRSNLLEAFPVPNTFVGVYLVSNNKLSGEIPSFICNLSSLAILDLSNNSLSGMLPKCLGNFSSDLSVLNLRMNNFHGSIPGTFAKGSSLRNLELNGNQLEGPLPRSLVHCSRLEVLDLGNNNINDTFPLWLESLPELQVLILRSNRFHGQIGNSRSRISFTKLRIIDLSHNEFTGLLPTRVLENLQAMMNVEEQKVKKRYMGDTSEEGKTYYYEDSVVVTMKQREIELGRIFTLFTTIDLSRNQFQGQIPKVIGKFKSLLVLNLSQCNLTGHIPTSLGNITALESLDLSWNKLVGKIPEQLISLTFLEVLSLSHNQLVGRIPQGKQFDTFENDSYSGNSGLCGLPLSEKCNNGEAPQPQPSLSHGDKDFGSGFDWKITLMGYGCGLVFGLSMGYIVFSTGKPQWFVRLVEGGRHKKVRTTSQRPQGRRN